MRKSRARVWQSARFDNDIDFLDRRVLANADANQSPLARACVFPLWRLTDFREIQKALTTEFVGHSVLWRGGGGDDADGERITLAGDDGN